MISTLQDEKGAKHNVKKVRIAKFEAKKQETSGFSQLMQKINTNFIISQNPKDLLKETKTYKDVVLRLRQKLRLQNETGEITTYRQRKHVNQRLGSVILILSGVAQVVFTDKQGEKHEVAQLRAGSVIGLSTLLEISVSTVSH